MKNGDWKKNRFVATPPPNPVSGEGMEDCHECNNACFEHLMGLIRGGEIDAAKAYVNYVDEVRRLSNWAAHVAEKEK